MLVSENSPLAPLRGPVFRILWLAWFAANLAMWMNEVAAAWLMTSLTDNALMVALVQAASTLPVFVLGLPSGALADIADRRRYFAVIQLWLTLVALLLGTLAFHNALSAPLLLALAFANGIGTAMRWPVFAAIVPDVVARSELTTALTLNGIAVNLSRMVGPVIAGVLLAGAGSQYVFLLNALLSITAFALILRWRPKPKSSALPGERFFAAMRVGLQHVLQSPRMRIVLAQVFMFMLQSISLTAMLPLVARGLPGGGPGTYTTLLVAMGGGAIAYALYLPYLSRYLARGKLVYVGTFAHALAAVVVAASPTLWLAAPAMAFAGMAWMGTASSLTVSAQTALPGWVRARGMSIYQMALMGGMAAGAVLWGYIASLTSVQTSIFAAAIAGVLSVLLTRRLDEHADDEDLTPATVMAMPEQRIQIRPEEGPVMCMIEYAIEPTRARDFHIVMQATRGARLRQGVLSWGLFRDTAEPGRYIEYFLDENWIEHQRRMERFTAADVSLRERRLAFHRSEEPPRIRLYLAESMDR